MPNLIADYVFDNGLTVIDTDANRLDICGTQPTTYTEATSTYTLGNKTSISVGAPENGDSSGRKVIVAAITDGSVTGNGTAGFFAVSDTGNSRLLAVGTISPTQAVTSGNTFTTPAIDITIPDAA